MNLFNRVSKDKDKEKENNVNIILNISYEILFLLK